MNGALEQLTATPNPMSFDGRVAVCRGALAHRDLRELLGRLKTPTVIVQGRQNLLVRMEHAEAYLAPHGGKASTFRELSARGQGVSVVRVAGGHLLLQETPQLLRRVLEAAIDDAWATLSEAELQAAAAQG
jgi:pimeloyl-ACP methyl ester carboxylesterase